MYRFSFGQGRLFSYSDTHRHRLGANYLQIPVNCPYKAKTFHYQRDGPQCVNDNQGQYFSKSVKIGQGQYSKSTRIPWFIWNKRWLAIAACNLLQVYAWLNPLGFFYVYYFVKNKKYRMTH